MTDEVLRLARGTIVFSGTETWRTLYDQLLNNLDVHVYYSVAWVNTFEYWNGPPAQQSMQLNYELVERGFRIERVLILPDELWPYEEPLPVPSIRSWIDEQHHCGIRLYLVREHDLQDEPGLLEDIGIYGNRATGRQELDDTSRTVRFTFDFGPQTVQSALARCQRLLLFAKPYSRMLDLVM